MWFYKTGTTAIGAVYTSRAWTVADDFARHGGITRRAYDWGTFAGRIKAGSFVGQAYPNGKVFHIGYVTKFAGMASDDGFTYRSFAIAQHTKNYHTWVHNNEGAKRWRERPDTYGDWYYFLLPYVDPGLSSREVVTYLVNNGYVTGEVVSDEREQSSYNAVSVTAIPEVCLQIIEYNRHDSRVEQFRRDMFIGADPFYAVNDNLFIAEYSYNNPHRCEEYWDGFEPTDKLKKIVAEFEKYEG
ncbi:hypothetical protein [Arcanobacterium ihumii]|uniref:hypothetical protein n=1 Tax=Arcanobacterium ihumii TaxID=2138162 RepID=UPI000F521DD7|nr:hypothetical protein [Arcanobacterium ihumii]